MIDPEQAPILDYQSKQEPGTAGVGSFLTAYFVGSVLIGLPLGALLLKWKLEYFYIGQQFIAAVIWFVVTAFVLIVRAWSHVPSPKSDVRRGALLGILSWVCVFLAFYLLVVGDGQYVVRRWP